MVPATWCPAPPQCRRGRDLPRRMKPGRCCSWLCASARQVVYPSPDSSAACLTSHVLRATALVRLPGAVADVLAAGVPGSKGGECPGGAAVRDTGFAGDGDTGADAAEAIGLVVAQEPGVRYAGDQVLSARGRDLVRGLAGGGRECPGWDTGQRLRWCGCVLSGRDKSRDKGGAPEDGNQVRAGQLAASARTRGVIHGAGRPWSNQGGAGGRDNAWRRRSTASIQAIWAW